MSTDTLPAPYPRLGRFLLRRSLGRGAEGEVYLALDTRDRRAVALKVIRRSLSSDVSLRARREASFIASLVHPNIVRVLAVGHHRQIWYIATEYVDGGSLFEHVQREGAVEVGWALRVVAEAADALDAVHRLGVVHCDVTPKNILLERDSGSPRLVDFGLAQLGVDVQRSRFVGTPQYVAPEVWRGGKPSPKSDIYALGLCLFYMLQGTSAVGARDVASCRRIHERGLAKPPTAWPEALRSLFVDATERAEVRLSARDLAQRARALISDLPASESLIPPQRHGRPPHGLDSHLHVDTLLARLRPLLQQHLEPPVLVTPDALLLLGEALAGGQASIEAMIAEADGRRRRDHRLWLGSSDLIGSELTRARREALRQVIGAVGPLVLPDELRWD
ncbi:MAG: serine/threonine-protein kinase [Myxococcota bacterium]